MQRLWGCERFQLQETVAALQFAVGGSFSNDSQHSSHHNSLVLDCDHSCCQNWICQESRKHDGESTCCHGAVVPVNAGVVFMRLRSCHRFLHTFIVEYKFPVVQSVCRMITFWMVFLLLYKQEYERRSYYDLCVFLK